MSRQNDKQIDTERLSEIAIDDESTRAELKQLLATQRESLDNFRKVYAERQNKLFNTTNRQEIDELQFILDANKKVIVDVENTVQKLRKELHAIDPNISNESSEVKSDVVKLEDNDNDSGKLLVKPTLEIQHDFIGDFYEFTNLKNDTVKVYLEYMLTGAKFHLNDIKNYPEWINGVKSFLEHYNFDDITEFDETSGDINKFDIRELQILKIIILKLLGNNFHKYTVGDKNVIDILRLIKNKFLKSFPREVKSKLWRNVLVDKNCCNLDKLKKFYRKLMVIELCGENQKNCNICFINMYLNRKIMSTLENTLSLSVTKLLQSKKLSIKEMSYEPKILIDAICTIILQIRRVEGVVEVFDDFTCQTCDSPFHVPENCPKPSSNSPSSEKIQP